MQFVDVCSQMKSTGEQSVHLHLYLVEGIIKLFKSSSYLNCPLFYGDVNYTILDYNYNYIILDYIFRRSDDYPSLFLSLL